MKRTCYQIEIRVYPTTEHPNFDSIKFGVLSVTVFSNDQKLSLGLACAIATQGPFRVGKGRLAKLSEGGHLTDRQVDAMVKALNAGIAVDFEFWDHSVDETERLGDWVGVVPYMEIP